MDSSVLVEILLSASDGPRMLSAIIKADTRSVSAPNWLETAMVFESRPPARTSAGIDRLIAEYGILAKHTGQPLLFKGNDFPQTDITPALAA